MAPAWISEVWIDGLTAALQQHEFPPADLKLCSVPCLSCIGPISLKLCFDANGGTVDEGSCLGFACHWNGAAADAPGGELRGCFAIYDGEGVLSQTGFAGPWGDSGVTGITWGELRDAAAAGVRLQAAIFLSRRSSSSSSSSQVAGDSRLRVAAAGGGGAAATGGSLLDGPFTDVTVIADGRSFRAHRVTLAAASPVFRSMFESSMAEGQAAAVELKETDATAVELLLQHVYGAAVEGPLLLAPALYGLADQYQLHTGLARQLQVWLGGVSVEPAALCRLLPAAYALCRNAYTAGLYWDASRSLAALQVLPEFSSWPADLLAEVIGEVNVQEGFAAAAAWMAAQPRRAKQRHKWKQLVAALKMDSATQADLRALWDHPQCAAVPGLQARVHDALDALCTRLQQQLDGHGGR